MYRDVFWHVILYGRGTSSVTLREDSRQRLFENRILRKIFGPKTEKQGAGWRKLHNEELYDLYFSTGIIRVIESRRLR
jgi:hypothetical protein